MRLADCDICVAIYQDHKIMQQVYFSELVKCYMLRYYVQYNDGIRYYYSIRNAKLAIKMRRYYES